MKDFFTKNVIFVIALSVILVLLLLVDTSLFRASRKNIQTTNERVGDIASEVMTIDIKLKGAAEEFDNVFKMIDALNTKIDEEKTKLQTFISSEETRRNSITVVETTTVVDPEKKAEESKDLKKSVDDLVSRMETSEKNIEANRISLMSSIEELKKKVDFTMTRLDTMKEEFSGEIASLRQEIEKSMKEIEKLGGEINRLDAENRTVHYNYDAVLKTAEKDQASTDVVPTVEEAVAPATTEVTEAVATDAPVDSTEAITTNTSEPVAEVAVTVVPEKKKNCFVRFFRWATFRKN